MIDAIDGNELEERISRKGPRTDKTAKAQKAVDEFLASGVAAAKVDWSDIADNYDAAKRVIAYRISYSKGAEMEGAHDLSMRSSRADGEIFLVHSERL